MKLLKKIVLFTLIAALAFTFVACGGNENEGGADNGDAKEVLEMATNAAFPPYEYKEGDDFAGIDIELAQAIADKLDMDLKINDVDFGTIVGGVETGKYDMGIAGMTVTEDRLKSVNFSESYATGIQVVIVKEGSDIKSVDDIGTKGATIGVQQDTTGDIYASDDYGADKVTQYKTGADAVQALITGKVDCVIIDNEPAKSFVAANEGLAILETEYIVENYAIAISKDNADLLKKVNDVIAEMKADGSLQKIIDKYIPAE